MIGTRVYIGGLSYRVSERDIDKFFRGYKRVGDIDMKNGFAFVEFDDRREADDAIYEMNGRELLGGKVIVAKAKGTPRQSQWGGDRGGGRYSGGGGGRGSRYYGGDGGRRMQRNSGQFGTSSHTKYRLRVMNLSSKVSWQDLKDFMRRAGEVTYADAHKQRKNEGVVEFASRSDMKNAYSKLNGKDLKGRRIELYDESDHDGGSRRRRSRTHSESRSRSRSRSPLSRSRSRSYSREKSSSRSASKEKDTYRTKSKSASRSRSPTPRRSYSKSPSRGRSERKGSS